MKNIKSWLILILGTILLAGCYGGDNNGEDVENVNDGEESKEKSILYVAAGGEIPTLKTNGTMDGLSETMIINVFEGLFRKDENSEPTEALVDDYEFDEKNLKYVFHLREDAKWSDDTPNTAHDFVYAWKKALHPDTISPHAYLFDSIENAADIQNPDSEIYGQVDELGVEATGDYTLEVQVVRNVPYFLSLLAHPVYYPQNEEFVESQKDDYALEPENLIFNGPFVLDSWNHDQKWTLKRNEAYWDKDNVKIDEIDFKVTKDTATEVNLYETDTIDIATLSSEYVDLYSDHEDYVTSLNAEMYFLRFNQRSEYMKNRNIRKALDMAWDKEQAAASILKNGSIPAYFLIFEGMTVSSEGEEFRAKYGDFNHDSVEAAQEIWAKGLEEIEETEIELELLSYDDEQRKSIAEHIKNQWEKNLPGLKITINQQPNKQKLAIEDEQKYDVSHSGWRNDIGDPVEFLNIFLSDGPYNWQDFENDDYDSLVKKSASDFSDLDARFAEMQEAEKILIDDEAAISPMYQSGSAKLIKPFVKDFVIHPNTTYSYKWVSVEK